MLCARVRVDHWRYDARSGEPGHFLTFEDGVLFARIDVGPHADGRD